jgi:hypothetical protein
MLSSKSLSHSAIPSVAALVLFVFLWLLDFPKPNFDDLFYTGAALNMAGGGDFSNPLLARQGFPSHFFFVYPPLHSYTLAGWLKIFGVSSGSMTAFAMIMITATSLATIAVLRRHKAGLWMELAVPLGAAFALLPLGLRPDSLAIALTMVGFALTDSSGKAELPRGIGFMLMLLGASAAPRVTLFSLALAVSACHRSWWQPSTSQEKLRTIAFMLGAAFLTGFVFLFLIHFRLGEFVMTFKFHSTRFVEMKETTLDRFKLFVLHQLRVLNWPLVLVPAGLMVFLYKKPKSSLSIAAIYTIGAFPLAGALGLIWLGAIWWPILAMLFLGAAALRFCSTHWRIGITAAILMSLVVANRRELIAVTGILSGKISADLGKQQAAALELKPETHHGLLIDSWVSRYLYHYKLPEGALNLEFGAPFPGTIPGYRPLTADQEPEFREGDVFLAGPVVVGILTKNTYLERTVLKWIPFGMTTYATEKNPRQVYIIPAESCRRRPAP